MLRFAILFAIAITAAFAARDALTGPEPFKLFSALLALALVILFVGTALRWKAGINLSAVACPNCHAPQSFIRKPGSFRQAMWGGHTCAACGTEMDKWGRKNQA